MERAKRDKAIRMVQRTFGRHCTDEYCIEWIEEEMKSIREKRDKTFYQQAQHALKLSVKKRIKQPLILYENKLLYYLAIDDN